MDTNKINGSLPRAPLNAVYATCGNTVQGMSVGWADPGRSLAGQSVDFTGNPTGDYCLSIVIDPKSRLVESNEGDNVSSTLLHVDVERASVTVLSSTGCTPAGATIVDVRGLSPTTGTTGSTSVPIRIFGSGFAAGMAVTFEGGSGPPPVVSNIVVSDGEIKGLLTIKKGKPGKDAKWDLCVGSGVLFDAFTVTR